MENEKQTEKKAQNGLRVIVFLAIAIIIGLMLNSKDNSKEPINQYAETFSGDIEVPENAKWMGPFFYSEWEPMGNQQN